MGPGGRRVWDLGSGNGGQERRGVMVIVIVGVIVGVIAGVIVIFTARSVVRGCWDPMHNKNHSYLRLVGNH